MLKIGLAGARGKMGQAIIQALAQEPELKLVAEINRPLKDGSPESRSGIHAVNQTLDVLIDFSNREALQDHLKFCLEKSCFLVLGVTGLQANDYEALKAASSKIPIVYSPNMSVGVNLAFSMIELAARVLKEDAEKGQTQVQIHEIHHQGKKDAPSGTALKMRDLITQEWTNLNAQSTEPSRLQDLVSITYERIGEVKGEHRLVFNLKDEQLTLVHQAEDRSIFAKGAILAAKWLAKQRSGLYDMRDVLGLPKD